MSTLARAGAAACTAACRTRNGCSTPLTTLAAEVEQHIKPIVVRRQTAQPLSTFLLGDFCHRSTSVTPTPTQTGHAHIQLTRRTYVSARRCGMLGHEARSCTTFASPKDQKVGTTIDWEVREMPPPPRPLPAGSSDWHQKRGPRACDDTWQCGTGRIEHPVALGELCQLVEDQ